MHRLAPVSQLTGLTNAHCPYCTWHLDQVDWHEALIAALRHAQDCVTAECNT